MAEKEKVSILRWKGLMADAPRAERIGIFVILVAAVASFSFTQLGLVGIGLPGQYVAYGNVLLAIVAVGGVLFGVRGSTLLGLIAGAAMVGHALFQPLDYFEVMFVTPLETMLMFAVFGFAMGFFMALALRRNPPLKRQVAYVVIICAVGSIAYSIAFVANVFFSLLATIADMAASMSETLDDESIRSILADNMRQMGSIELQILFDALLMVAACLFAMFLVHKAKANGGRHSLPAVFRAWLFGIVIAAFAVSGGVSFTVVTEQTKAEADKSMSEEIDYIIKQIDTYETRIGIIDKLAANGDISERAVEESEEDDLYRAFSIDGTLDGYSAEEDGTIVIFQDGKILLSDDENYVVGEPWENYTAGNPKEFLDGLAAEDRMVQVSYDSDNVRKSENESIVDALSGNITTTTAYVRVGTYRDYYVMMVYPASKVFASRYAVMAWTTLSVLVLLVAIFGFTSWLLRRIVVRRIDDTNQVLSEITAGNLEARVAIGDTVELASLSDGINTTVDALRGWISEAETRMEAELNTAKAIQESALPRTFPPFPDILRFDIYASMQAAREVGGDFYDFFLVGDDADAEGGKLGFVIADVSGKGVPAALFMMTAKTLIRDYIQAGLDLGEAIENANRQLCESNDAGMFVTVFAGVLDYGTGHVVYVNAGHNPPLLWQPAEWRWLTDKSGLPLGLFDGLPYKTFEMDCSIGDQLLLYTDGVTEAMNVNDELYGEERLKALAEQCFTLHPRMLVRSLRHDVALFAQGAEQSDDITILALEVGVPPEKTATLIVPATVDELPHVNDFVHMELDRRLCPLKTQKQLDIAIEELFVNVAHYAYPDATPDKPGVARIGCTYSADPPSVRVEIADDGIPYNPLAKPDAVTPDDIMEVPIGGLGILMAKRSVDEMSYERAGNSNVVTIVKKW